MAIQAISVNSSRPAFGIGEADKKQTEAITSGEKPGMSKNAKIGLWTGGIAAAGVAAWFLYKGKGKKAAEAAKKPMSEFVEQLVNKPLSKETQNVLNELKIADANKVVANMEAITTRGNAATQAKLSKEYNAINWDAKLISREELLASMEK